MEHVVWIDIGWMGNTLLVHFICSKWTMKTRDDIRAYFSIIRHAYGMKKGGHILVNLGQLKNETPLKET